MMKAWISVSAVEKESDGQRQIMFFRWKKAVLDVSIDAVQKRGCC